MLQQLPLPLAVLAGARAREGRSRRKAASERGTAAAPRQPGPPFGGAAVPSRLGEGKLLAWGLVCVSKDGSLAWPIVSQDLERLPSLGTN